MAEAIDAQQWIHTAQVLAAVSNPHTKQKVKPYELNPYTAHRAHEPSIKDLTQMWAPPDSEQGQIHEREIVKHDPPA